MTKLTSEQEDIVRRILRKWVPTRNVSIFGSRARGTKKPFADLDLLILGSNPLPLVTITELREAFSESNLPFRVDIVEEANASPEFLDAIRKDSIAILS